jgi:dienelactone hydrolase
MRLGLMEAVLWSDTAGHVVMISVPAQHFTAVRDDMTDLVAPLEDALAKGGDTGSADYSAPPGAPYTAQEVTVPAGGYVLGGTLLLPKGGHAPYPAVITITGSGQQDRDEALGIAGLEHFRPFRQIAEALASAGIAVLRVDDRGVGKSTGAETLDSATTSSFAGDTRAQVAYLRTRPEIDPDRIALVGHSEGGVIAPMVAASDPRIAAIVLLAGTAKSGGEVSVEQLTDLLSRDTTKTASERAAILEQQREAVRKVLAGEDLPGQRYMRWMREYFSYDPLPTMRKVKQPVLILQGGRDRQVPPDHADLLARAAREGGNTDVTEHVFPTLNHLFLPATTGAVSEYSSLEVTSLGADVIDTIRDWLVKHLRPAH